MFQSTRPRGARRDLQYWSCCLIPVSIHAPARGATWSSLPPSRENVKVSIHAPARGATQARASCEMSSKVSIHAPARGATDALAVIVAVIASFNPRAREGRDAFPLFERWQPVRFNPRAREGRDTFTLECRQICSMFQSTRPRGARRLLTIFDLTTDKFQSTRPRGARLNTSL